MTTLRPLMVFAISIFAWKHQTMELEHRAFCTFDGTEAEAHTAGLKEAFRLWPASAGWQDHHTQVQPIEIHFKSDTQAIAAMQPETQPEFVM